VTSGLLSLLHDIVLGLCLLGAWFVIGFYALLTLAGYVYSRQAARSRQRLPHADELPGVSILVPAHNEEIVVAGTIESILHLDYPRHLMEIIIVEDSSSDGTRRIIEHLMGTDRRLKLVSIPPGFGGKGKSHALNVGLRYASHDLIAVYDADNAPEPSSLRLLVGELLADAKLGAAVGKVRTLNRSANFLTRCINIEFITFQWIIQAGRWRVFRLSSLPGTNYVIRREALERSGGWDPEAIADDAELTVRMAQQGYQIKFVPYAVTWEPEPQDWAVWLRQRLRWARGGTYVVRKFVPRLLRVRRRDLILEVLHLISIYHFFFLVLLVSDLMFIVGLATGLSLGASAGPLMILWALAFALFLLEFAVALAVEGENTPLNLLIAAVMYFTYCQAWVYVCAKAHYLDMVRQERLTWEKTVRVEWPVSRAGR